MLKRTAKYFIGPQTLSDVVKFWGIKNDKNKGAREQGKHCQKNESFYAT